jgi:hypothetical protein
MIMQAEKNAILKRPTGELAHLALRRTFQTMSKSASRTKMQGFSNDP